MAKILKKCDCRNKTRCPHPWTVRYREPGGPAGGQHEKSFALKKDAEAFGVKVEREKDLGTYIDPELGKMPLVDVFDEWATGGDRVGNTRANYETMKRRALEPFFGRKLVSTILPADVKAWVEWQREKGYAESTIINRFSCLSAAFRWAVDNGRRPDNPCLKVKLKRAKTQRAVKANITIPTLAELQAIAEAVPAEYRVMVWLMAGCGLRIGETTALTIGQIDFTAGMIAVDRQVTMDGKNTAGEGWTPANQGATKGKGRSMQVRKIKWREDGEARMVPIPDTVAWEVRRHVKQYGTIKLENAPRMMAGEYLFGNVSRTNVVHVTHLRRKVWNPAITEAEADHINPHSLRHYFASAALAGGVPVNELAEWMGHRDPSFTFRQYQHLMPDAASRFRNVMDAALAGGLTVEIEGEGSKSGDDAGDAAAEAC